MTTAQTADPETADSVAAEARTAELRQALPGWVANAAGFKAEPARNPSLPTLVGLLILILCFFVVLTSISLRDKKRENSVMSSLEQTFAGQGAAARSQPASTEQETHKILGNLRAAITAEVPLVTGTAAVSADDLMLPLPRNLVFAADGTRLAADFPHILRQTKAALSGSPSDFAYEVEVAITAAKRDDAAVASGALIDQSLRSAGFAPGSAVVSLSEGKPEGIVLIVRLRPNARLENSGDAP
jgi:hypothetical protein